MKKITLLIVLALIFAFSAEAKKIKGRIILEYDTLEVTFKIKVNFFTQTPNFELLQYKVIYFDDAGNKKVLLPQYCKEIQFTHETVKVRMLSRQNTLGLGGKLFPKTHVFLRLHIDGPMKLFNYYFTASTPTMMGGGMVGAPMMSGAMVGAISYSADSFILQKDDEQMIRPSPISFRKDLMLYFSDCPELSQKIESKEFRSGEIVQMVKFYNSNCAQGYNPAANVE